MLRNFGRGSDSCYTLLHAGGTIKNGQKKSYVICE